MLKRVLFALALTLAVLTPLPRASAQSEVTRIAQSVVMIVNLGPNGQPRSSGSGTIVSADGSIITNRHVVEGGGDFAIFITQDVAEPPVHRYFARVVRVSRDFDFAILQIDRAANRQPVSAAALALPVIRLAQNPVDLGDEVRIFGFPGLADDHLSLTQGRIATIQNGVVGGARIPIWNQTDAEISPGNSGGLAVNERGEFVGIPTSVSQEGRTGGRLGYLLPLQLVRALIERDQALGPNDAETQRASAPQPNGPARGLDFDMAPNFGGVTLAPGFLPDPFTMDIVAGGDLDAASFGYGQHCVGFATTQPDFSVNVTGRSPGLHFYFVGNGDTALIINDPQGRWHCNDDSYNTLNPAVDFPRAAPGRYDIWVTSFTQGAFPKGRLFVSERATASPINPAGQTRR